MEKKEEYNPISYDNSFFKSLEERGVHPVEYMDFLFEQKKVLLDKLFQVLNKDELKELGEKLNQLNPLILDKLRNF